MKHLILLMSLLTSYDATAKNQEIHEFRFSTCSATHCLELLSAIGMMSQLQFSFSTTGATVIHISNLKTHEQTVYEGIESSYLPKLNMIKLSRSDQGATVISLVDFKTETFPGQPPLNRKEKL